MIENLQDELYQLENKQAKGAKLRANIRSWRAKNAPKLSSKYLKDWIWKIKQNELLERITSGNGMTPRKASTQIGTYKITWKSVNNQ